MNTNAATRSFTIKWFPIHFVLGTLALAWLYLQSASSHRYATDADTALIRPVVYLLTALTPFVILTCVERTPDDRQTQDRLPNGSILVILSIPIVLCGFVAFGFAPTAILSSFLLTYILSQGRLSLSIISTFLAGAITIGLFRTILGVEIPLWPMWF